MLRGVGQLVQEIEAKEDALARASSRPEVIQKGSAELTRKWNLLSVMWKGLERKNKLWKAVSLCPPSLEKVGDRT